ncbi:MAG: DUF4296 domain-containing protein [Rikenellaceae bacterium]
MKNILLSLLLALTFLAPSCIRRTVIPDDELALIFRDAFLVNAYVLNARFDIDTLQIYQPIFEKYGYTSEDVSYTVGSFSKRKSARLSDIVEQSIRLLEVGEGLYAHEAMIIDTIEAKALRAATAAIYHKERINYHSQRDTSKLKLQIDSLPPGDYILSFTYHVDTLDNNRSSYRSLSWVENDDSDDRKQTQSTNLRKHTETTFERKIIFRDSVDRFMILLAESFEAKRTPHVTFTDITLEYTPEAEIAVERMFKNKLDVRIFYDDFFSEQKADSLELSPL